MLLLNQSPSSLKGLKEMAKCLRTERNSVSLQFSEGNMEDQETTGQSVSPPTLER